MALTVDQAVAEVVSRLRGLLASCGMSVLIDDTNPDVVPSVRDALPYFGLEPAAYPTVDDNDLAGVTDPRWFAEAATLETLYRVQANCLKVDSKVDKNEQKLSQRAGQVAALIVQYESRVPRLRTILPAVGQLNDPTYLPGVTAPSCLPTPAVPPYRPRPWPYHGMWGVP